MGVRTIDPGDAVESKGRSQITVAGGEWFESHSSFDDAKECIRAIPPNKAPEPTPVAVMPRATESAFEMKPRTENRSAARVMPATGVAHL